MDSPLGEHPYDPAMIGESVMTSGHGRRRNGMPAADIRSATKINVICQFLQGFQGISGFGSVPVANRKTEVRRDVRPAYLLSNVHEILPRMKCHHASAGRALLKFYFLTSQERPRPDNHSCPMLPRTSLLHKLAFNRRWWRQKRESVLLETAIPACPATLSAGCAGPSCSLSATGCRCRQASRIPIARPH